MNPNIRNILGILAGILVGGIVNMGIIYIGNKLIPPPLGVDVSDIQQIASSLNLFEPKHFLFPFLAHALGTFSGAFVAGSIANTQKMIFALILGILNLLGGVANSLMLPAPLWFNLVDLFLAYLPMAWLAGKLAMRRNPS